MRGQCTQNQNTSSGLGAAKSEKSRLDPLAMVLLVVAVMAFGVAPSVALAQVGAFTEQSGEKKSDEKKADEAKPAATTPATPATPEAPAAATPADEPEDPDDPTVVKSTLRLVGEGCDVNAAESAVLRQPGVVAVDSESLKGHLIVTYSNTKSTPQQMGSAIKVRVENHEKKKKADEAIQKARSKSKPKKDPFGIMSLTELQVKGCDVLLVK